MAVFYCAGPAEVVVECGIETGKQQQAGKQHVPRDRVCAGLSRYRLAGRIPQSHGNEHRQAREGDRGGGHLKNARRGNAGNPHRQHQDQERKGKTEIGEPVDKGFVERKAGRNQ